MKYSKPSTQGTNYYAGSEIEKLRYTHYRLANRVKAEKAYRDNEHLPFPLHVIIETSSLCQLKCGFCNRENMLRKNQNLNYKLFKMIADQCAQGGAFSLSLYALGEPFLNPNLRDMIVYAKKLGIPYCDLSSNGMKPMDGVMGIGLNELIVSLDGDKQTHECLRPGANYDLIINNLRKLRGVGRPIIRVQIIDIPETHNQIPKFVDYWLENGADVVYCKNVEAMSQNLGNKNLPQDEIALRIKNRTPCKQLWFCLTVNSDGSIAACCHDPQGKSILGHINNMTMKQAWDRLGEIRDRHKNGDYRDFNGLCDSCCDYNW